MRSLIFLISMGFGVVAGANTNGGGVLSVKAPLADGAMVFKLGQTHDSILFAEGRPVAGKWIIKSRSVRDQDLRLEDGVMDALVRSVESGKWEPISN